ncbi:uncharacterized protein LOC132309374 [Cornus florida]|uniref:uncharacterized protein LOC132309374 n=1 Tax=Cornus florida TaxID=4283 RepID=UPI00289E9019|nr:uncharacterized protein LOC132309374 [Cornus florida]
MDRSWITQSRLSSAYLRGVEEFLDISFERVGKDGSIYCPCTDCGNCIKKTRSEVRDDLVCNKFIQSYTTWFYHWEKVPSSSQQTDVHTTHDDINANKNNDMHGVLHKGFGVPTERREETNGENDQHQRVSNEELDKFYRLLEDANQELYLGCKKFSKLSYVVKLYLVKTKYNWSDKSFTDLLKVIKDGLPDGETLPKTFNETKKMIGDLGLKYDKIHACPSDCMLYWKEHSNDEMCYNCGKSRLQRLFMSSKTTSSMRWHAEERIKDGLMRHPADSPAWDSFDKRYLTFSSDPRNVRLALATDGFNPFNTMSVAHSTWPPLIEELKELWVDGVETYDASRNEMFRMHAALFWTLSDFPGYAMVSGWSTKGYLACPTCNKGSCFHFLDHSKKLCYDGHRCFLEKDHKYRRCKSTFDGTEKSVHTMNEDRKREDRTRPPHNWRKKSIFFQLPYWKYNLLLHNLDVMHIEKNICDNILHTLMNDQKGKDGLKTRLDLQDMGVRLLLHPQERGSNKFYLPPASFTLSSLEKSTLCRVLKNVKVPDGYAFNISRCVKLKERTISGLKSHDCHILMQQLLAIAIRRILPKNVCSVLVELSNFYRELCSKTFRPEDLIN